MDETGQMSTEILLPNFLRRNFCSAENTKKKVAAKTTKHDDKKHHRRMKKHKKQMENVRKNERNLYADDKTFAVFY